MLISFIKNRKFRGCFLVGTSLLWIVATHESILPLAGCWAIGIILFMWGAYLCFSSKKPTEGVSARSVDVSRRSFLTFAATLAHDEGLQAIQSKVALGTSAFTGNRNPKSRYPVLPAGIDTFEKFKSRCNFCLACIQACPSHVLEPGMKIGQGVLPQQSFRMGWCDASCHTCSEVCPTGAITTLTAEEKSLVQTGHAIWIKENCRLTDGETCQACVDACPYGCIEEVRNGRKTYLLVSNHRCTGCGACEFSCPASPLKGIYIEAERNHRSLLS